MLIIVEPVCYRCLARLPMRPVPEQDRFDDAILMRRMAQTVTCTQCGHENVNVKFYVEVTHATV